MGLSAMWRRLRERTALRLAPWVFEERNQAIDAYRWAQAGLDAKRDF